MQYFQPFTNFKCVAQARKHDCMAIDLELIERCRRGDRRAFGELYEACREPLLRVCEAITGDGEAAEDVLHDGFIVVMGGMGQLRDSSKAEGWMRRIMTNLALRYRDEAARTVRLGAADGAAGSPEEGRASVPAIEELLSMVDSLPEGYGRVFRLAVLDGLSHGEIAAMLGIAPKSSSSQLRRARLALQRMVSARMGRIAMLAVALLSATGLLLLRRADKAMPGTGQPAVAHRGIKPAAGSAQAAPGSASGGSLRAPSPVGGGNVAVSATRGDTPAEALRPVCAVALPRPGTPALCARPLPSGFIPTAASLPPLPERPAPWRAKVLPSLVSAGGLSAGSIVSQALRAVGGIGSGTRGGIETWEELNHYLTYEVGDGMDPLMKDALTRISLGNEGRITTRRSFAPPLAVGIGLTCRLGRNWEIEAALRLTMLAATMQTGSSDTTNITTRQRVWCAGVPLAVNYTVLSRGRWRIYATAGLAVDVPFRATSHTRFNVDNKAVLTRTSRPALPPAQLSVTAGAGIGCELWPHVELYVSPGVTWHVPAGHAATPTLWTERPLQLSLPVGIRLRY